MDADCRVHGIHNLYIAGSSVFPTYGASNPTLTILALALRLADHLKQRLAEAPGTATAVSIPLKQVQSLPDVGHRRAKILWEGECHDPQEVPHPRDHSEGDFVARGDCFGHRAEPRVVPAPRPHAQRVCR